MGIILGLRVATQGKFEHTSWWIYLSYSKRFSRPELKVTVVECISLNHSHCTWQSEMFLEKGKSTLSRQSDYTKKFQQKQKGKLRFVAKLHGLIPRHLYTTTTTKSHKLWSRELSSGVECLASTWGLRVLCYVLGSH